MKYAVDVPNFGRWADPRAVADLAAGIETAGWDGLSVWDHITGWAGNAVADPWVLLSAAASATSRIALMSMVTPLPRRRPWVLARQTVSLDRLSGGRLILGVGIGFPPDTEFGVFDEPTDERVRAAMLDEGLAVLEGLWSGEPFTFSGTHYTVREVTFLPAPVQRPRIPIWVAGMWPARRPFRRAARYDGVAPIVYDGGAFRGTTASVIEEVVDYVSRYRDDMTGFDVTVAGMLPGSDSEAAQALRRMRDTGATWWREGWNPSSGVSQDDWLRRVLEGPVRP